MARQRYAGSSALPHRRAILVIGYEGNDEWMQKVLPPQGKTKFNAKGTIKVLARLELKDGEHVDITRLRAESCSTSRG